jgi:hypothetical protein
MAAVQYSTGSSAVDGSGGVWRIGSVKRRRLFAKVRGWPLWRGSAVSDEEKWDREVSFNFYYFFATEMSLYFGACVSQCDTASVVAILDPVPLISLESFKADIIYFSA